MFNKNTAFQVVIFSLLIFFNNILSQTPQVQVQYLRGQAWLVVTTLPKHSSEWTVYNHLGKPIHQLVLPSGPSPAYFDISSWSYGLYSFKWTANQQTGTGQFGLMPWAGMAEPQSIKD
jgi:hypothetical protein